MTEEQEKTIREQAKTLKAERTAVARAAIVKQMVTVITTALALVAALFWQTAINDTIKTFIPVSGAWVYEIVVALIVTAGAAIVIYLLSKQTGEKKWFSSCLGPI